MSSLLQVLAGQELTPPPIWMMRQAGRHLPEYMKIRKTAKDFIDFCFTPEKAAEVTLQPVRRYDMDAAILFADILLIPIGLGREVTFVKGVGPVLEPLTVKDVSKIEAIAPEAAADHISSVYETVRRVRAGLSPDKALIGFCGGPWTVATYMIEGKGSPTKEIAKRFAYEHPEAMDGLLMSLARASADYLIGQARAGADVLKIFESWAENLSPYQFEQLVIKPTRYIVDRVRDAGLSQPIIGFPRGAGAKTIDYVKRTRIDALAAGTDMHLSWLRSELSETMAVQGNLDPLGY